MGYWDPPPPFQGLIGLSIHACAYRCLSVHALKLYVSISLSVHAHMYVSISLSVHAYMLVCGNLSV